MPSWEFYQAPERGDGIAFPLWWICGLSTGVGGAPGNNVVPWRPYAPQGTMWAVPFNQLRDATVHRMAFNLVSLGDAGAWVRLGIYENFSDTSMKPGTKIIGTDTIGIGPGNTAGRAKVVSNLNARLQAGKRYWAVLAVNDVAGSSWNARILNHPLY